MRKILLAACSTLLLTLSVQIAQAAPAPVTTTQRPAAFQRSVATKSVHRAAPGAVPAASPGYLPSEFECVARGTRNVKLDCDSNAPNNEPDIHVDPTNPNHMVASSNDYDSAGDEYYTTFDGGKTWLTGDMSLESKLRTGSDPVTVFDPKHHTVIHSSLNYLFTEKGESTNGDLVVSLSTDGGRNWGKPVVVYGGWGADSAPLQIFNDKEWMVNDSNPKSPHYGRTYLTWSRFLSRNGDYKESPIWEAHSDDGGRTWSKAHEISGSSPTCTYQTEGPALQCDEDQASVPTVGPNGMVSVAFLNGQHAAAWERGEQFEDQYMVVRSMDGGRTWTRPVHVVDMEDGSRDYPLNVDGRQTLTGMQARIWGAGNITASPINGRLYLVFSDNRAGRHDVDHPVTNSNVYLVSSTDGVHWSSPLAVGATPLDQFYPWVDVNPRTGDVGILYLSRTSLTTYQAEFATGHFGAFKVIRASTAASHTHDNIWFQAGSDAPDCSKCTRFFGDYNSFEFGSDGSANLVWTDLRRYIHDSGESGYTENIFFARIR